MSARTQTGKGSRLVAGVTLATVLLAVTMPEARAGDPAKILRAMADYTVAQKSFSATFESDVEVVTAELEKIQFSSSGKIQIARPDKLRISRTGGYTDVDLIYDGKTASIYGNNAKVYVQADMVGTVDQLIDLIQTRSGIAMPGTDLLLTNTYDELMSNVVLAQHIGQGLVDGVECEHLAFRGVDVDWQIWIEAGARPLPRKYVITSKAVTGAPQYTLRIRDWKTDPVADADTFAFKPPAGLTKVDLQAGVMAEFDEIPPGAVSGAKK